MAQASQEPRIGNVVKAWTKTLLVNNVCWKKKRLAGAELKAAGRWLACFSCIIGPLLSLCTECKAECCYWLPARHASWFACIDHIYIIDGCEVYHIMTASSRTRTFTLSWYMVCMHWSHLCMSVCAPSRLPVWQHLSSKFHLFLETVIDLYSWSLIDDSVNFIEHTGIFRLVSLTGYNLLVLDVELDVVNRHSRSWWQPSCPDHRSVGI